MTVTMTADTLPIPRPQDLELMQHFAAHTYNRLSVAGLTDELWQTLFRGDPAIKNRTFTSFRSALDGINQDNCHAVFAFAVLAMVYAVASPSAGAIRPRSKILDGAAVPATSSRELPTIAVEGWDWIIEGPFGDFLDMDQCIKLADVRDGDEALFTRLNNLNNSLLSGVDPLGHATITTVIELMGRVFRGDIDLLFGLRALGYIFETPQPVMEGGQHGRDTGCRDDQRTT
ncbi:uncharacterized protein Z519_12165 [Cladophialophora bantiana CBS 173.52]|uniref:Uncharacterized protein n=1 Tax=Cladophialophora bantiana (strain ATCC 10958 / CBS 173.52 / CDC B-1940 / NIH 8579) TaxID=1442370 RepID=A0A0D2FKP4_CLAB1|nr:uncharacterized protein Z519_12165 [Cladophialophora bantiana CBS 173.52]KIW87262.1 hypothetical protein Z519_12165 [Cladophialophora bantiana CBS 173.52]